MIADPMHDETIPADPRAGPPQAVAARRLAGWVLTVGLAWRLALCLVVVPQWESHAGVGPAPDHYPSLARSLLERQTLGYGEGGANSTTVRGPGFPAYLALGIVLGGNGNRWLGLWSSLPGLLVGATIAWLAAREWGVLAGAGAGAVAVLHPLPSFIAARVMGDDFYGAVGFVALLAWSRALRNGPRRTVLAWTAGAGLLLAVLMLSRSSGLLTLVAAVLVGLRPRAARVSPTLVLVALALAPPLAWSLRSSSLEGRPVFVHSLVAYNFWLGEGYDRAQATAGRGDRYPDALRFVLHQAGYPEKEAGRFWYGELQPREVADLEHKLSRDAIERIRRNPLSYAGRFARGLVQYWFRAQTTRRTLQYVLACLPVLVLAAYGLWTQRGRARRGDALVLLLGLNLALHDIAYAAVLPMARLSVQVYPALAYLVGAGVHGVLASMRRLR